MQDYGYSYFCGANVVVEIEGMPLLECAGLRIGIMESKRPIYGYSSRHFDAVAAGQVLVEGSLLINYVDHNYLFRCIEEGLRDAGLLLGGAPPAVDVAGDLADELNDPAQTAGLIAQYRNDPVGNSAVISALQDKLWFGTQEFATPPQAFPNPHDSFSGLDIRVTFGDRDTSNFETGLTGYLVQNVHFLGRSQRIAVDEEVIVEEYPFFARNMANVKMPYQVIVANDNGEETTSLIRN